MSADPRKSVILGRMASLLVPLGYRRRGMIFSRKTCDMIHMVGLQSSQDSTREVVIVTVNLAAVSVPLADALWGATRRLSVWDAHWDYRLGHLTPYRADKWWSVRSPEEAEALGDEIAVLLRDYGLPALASVETSAQLLALWRSGWSPGITDVYRGRLEPVLAKLVEANGTPE
jgi:hypothetical protein